MEAARDAPPAQAPCLDPLDPGIRGGRRLVRALLPADASAGSGSARPRRARDFHDSRHRRLLGRAEGKTFSSFSFGSTAGSVLVRHPAGDVLIDTGNSSHFDDEIRGFPFGTWLQLKSLAGELKPESPLPQLLRQIGEDPAKLRWAILSHVHLDHFGGLMDLPPLPVLLPREELRFAKD